MSGDGPAPGKQLLCDNDLWDGCSHHLGGEPRPVCRGSRVRRGEKQEASMKAFSNQFEARIY